MHRVILVSVMVLLFSACGRMQILDQPVASSIVLNDSGDVAVLLVNVDWERIRQESLLGNNPMKTSVLGVVTFATSDTIMDAGSNNLQKFGPGPATHVLVSNGINVIRIEGEVGHHQVRFAIFGGKYGYSTDWRPLNELRTLEANGVDVLEMHLPSKE